MAAEAGRCSPGEKGPHPAGSGVEGAGGVGLGERICYLARRSASWARSGVEGAGCWWGICHGLVRRVHPAARSARGGGGGGICSLVRRVGASWASTRVEGRG